MAIFIAMNAKYIENRSFMESLREANVLETLICQTLTQAGYDSFALYDKEADAVINNKYAEIKRDNKSSSSGNFYIEMINSKSNTISGLLKSVDQNVAYFIIADTSKSKDAHFHVFKSRQLMSFLKEQNKLGTARKVEAYSGNSKGILISKQLLLNGIKHKRYSISNFKQRFNELNNSSFFLTKQFDEIRKEKNDKCKLLSIFNQTF